MVLKRKDLRGSRLRCLMLTSLSRDHVADVLTKLIEPFGEVRPEDHWKPEGFLGPAEAKLGEDLDFLPTESRQILTRWWLKASRAANTPNWDLVSTCTVRDRRGLVLVEAKAHEAELRPEGKTITAATNLQNHEHIGNAIYEADHALNGVLPGWSLSRDSHYQLANRFAWAWKLADMGLPTILIYLGFLNAAEMKDQGHHFIDHSQWLDCMTAHGTGVVPEEAWERSLLIRSTPLVALIRSADILVATRPKKVRLF